MRLRFRFYDLVYKLTGREWGGTPSPPPDMLRGRIEGGPGPGYDLLVVEDGFRIAISYAESETDIHTFRADTMHKLATWYLWEYWVKGTWCGVKRRMHYWALRKKLRAQGVKTPPRKKEVAPDA